MDAFNAIMNFVLDAEGGYCNDPNDPGGETKYGIDKRDHPDVDIKNLTVDQAKAIYKAKYWDVIRADSVPWPLSAVYMDTAVNQGPSAAVRILQQAIGTEVDGIIGPNTLKAAANSSDDAIIRYLTLRSIRYTNTANFDRYGIGWFNRLFRLTRYISEPANSVDS